MPKLEIIAEIPFKEVITSIELTDLTGNGKDSLILTTMNGDLRIFEFEVGKKVRATEIMKTGNLPPVAAMALGDVMGNGVKDFVLGGLDNMLRVVSFMDDELGVRATTPLGTLPTAICVTNVVSDDSAEVIVATADSTLRCYGWFDVALDKLAQKVVDRPVFSMKPLRSRGLSFSRFVFGDDAGYLYVYQYADDRLHEIYRSKVKGEISLVATGAVTGGLSDEILIISDDKQLTLYGIDQGELKQLTNIRAPSLITSVRIGHLLDKAGADGQIVSCQGNSNITVLSYESRMLTPEASIRPVKKAAKALVALGDVTGDGTIEIVQSVGRKLYLMSMVPD